MCNMALVYSTRKHEESERTPKLHHKHVIKFECNIPHLFIGMYNGLSRMVLQTIRIKQNYDGLSRMVLRTIRIKQNYTTPLIFLLEYTISIED